MEALDVVVGVGGEGDGEAVFVDDVLVVGDLAGERVAGGRDGDAEFVPEDVPDLAEGGAGDDDLGVGAGVEPPDDGAGGGPVLARGVARGDGDAGLLCEGFQDFLLLVVGSACCAEDVLGEADGVVLVLFEHGSGLLHALNEKTARPLCCRAARPPSGVLWVGVSDASVTDGRQLRNGVVSHYAVIPRRGLSGIRSRAARLPGHQSGS